MAMIRAVAAVLLDILRDIFDVLVFFAAVAVLTFALGLVISLHVAFVPSLLMVSLWRGYRLARRIERARAREQLP